MICCALFCSSLWLKGVSFPVEGVPFVQMCCIQGRASSLKNFVEASLGI